MSLTRSKQHPLRTLCLLDGPIMSCTAPSATRTASTSGIISAGQPLEASKITEGSFLPVLIKLLQTSCLSSPYGVGRVRGAGLDGHEWSLDALC